MYRWQRSFQTILGGVMGLAILIGLNVLAIKSGWRWDTTTDKRHSLTSEAVSILKGLNTTVTATAFFLPGDSRELTEDLFKLVAGETHRFTYEFVDPDRAPLRAKQSQVTQRGSVVVNSGNRQEIVVFPDQEKLVNAIFRVSSAKPTKILLVTGHGELDTDATLPDPDACSQLKKILIDQGTEVEKSTLATLPSIAPDTDAVLLLGAKKDLLNQELQLLSNYLDTGGRLLIALAAEEHNNLDGWLESRLGLSHQAGLVIDPVSKLISGDPFTPLVQTYGASSITRAFNLMTFYPTCTSLAPLDVSKKTSDRVDQPVAILKPLGLSTEQSWLETNTTALRAGGIVAFDPLTDLPGPLWLSAIYEVEIPSNKVEPASLDKDTSQQTKETTKIVKQRFARALVFGDHDFLADKYIRLVGNLDLVRNGINWLLEREELITVSKPKPTNVSLLLSPLERQLTNLLPLIFIPSIILTIGVIMTIKRRRAC